jgi:hypothetical protein
MADPGYRLPDGDADTDDIACTLVYYPNLPEYRAALLGSLHGLASWTNWERDAAHKGKDAADSWKIANELTEECWRMACLEELQANVAAILAVLQSKRDCCEDGTTYGDTTIYNTTIFPGSGDAPDYYGETEVTDWDDWKEHVCHNAHLWVDELISQGNSLETVLDVGGISVGLVAFAIAAIALFVVGGFISAPVVIAVVAGLVAGYTSNMFSDAANDIEDFRREIVCALLEGTSLSDAVEDALGSGTAWDLFYSHIDYDSATAIIYEGGDGDIYLEPDTKSNCESCEGMGQYYIFDDWEDDTYAPLLVASGPIFHIYEPFNYFEWDYSDTSGRIYYSVHWLRALAGLSYGAGDTVKIHQIKFEYRMTGAAAGSVKMKFVDDTGERIYYAPNNTDWSEYTKVLSPARVATYNLDNVLMLTTSGGTGYKLQIRSLTVDFDASPD